ncbi:MAG TPA: prolyl oligopeptidase family serine peptidase [Trebonia sp.]
MTEIAPYGTWKSPISAADVARGKVLVAFPSIVGGEVWWQESRPDEGGRVTVMAAADGPGAGAAPRELLPAPWYARNRVHEYGGKSYLPVPSLSGGFVLVFANFADQRLYAMPAAGGASATGGEPAPLTPPDGGFRFADLVLSPDGREVWCVRETVSGDGTVRRAIVAVPLDGSAAGDAAAMRTLVTGADFFAFPEPSPDGTKLAWISWDHPRMPWDGTELRVGPAAGGVSVADATLVMGGPEESVLAPRWRDDESLYVISDASGWWNPYLVSASGGAPHALCPREEEFAEPLWQLGGRPFEVLGDGRLAVVHGAGELRFAVLDPAAGTLTDVELPGFRVLQGDVVAAGSTVAAVAGGPRVPWTVLRAALGDSVSVEAIREQPVTAPDPAYLPDARPGQLSASPNGPVVHALVYAPANPDAAGPAGELPPYLVHVHGGPTANSLPVLSLEKAFFTSRGIGVIDVNYGGSSGYGRAYRERLRGQWGVVDVADVMYAALALARSGEADRARLGIRGGSAGGWTALAAVTSGLTGAPQAVFAAATSYYGVSDLRPFAADTHDFESRYLDGLIGPLPEAEALYAERAPVGHVTPLTCPVLLLQGLDDPIVPPSQSEAIARDLAAHGIPHAYIAFEGESHGFRKTETNIAALEAELAFYGRVFEFTPPDVPPITLS